MKLIPVEWSESFAVSISTALGSDSSIIQQQVESGRSQAWQFVCDGEILGYAVTRLEPDTLVVVAYEGVSVESFGDMIVRIATVKELPYARFHTTRPGLIKLLACFDPEPLEYVTRIKCYGR